MTTSSTTINLTKVWYDVSQKYGSQCMVLSVEAKKQNEGNWEVYTDCARESTGIDVTDWIQEAEALGAGEILLTSIDQEGTAKGYDFELIKTVSLLELTNIFSIPVLLNIFTR